MFTLSCGKRRLLVLPVGVLAVAAVAGLAAVAQEPANKRVSNAGADTAAERGAKELYEQLKLVREIGLTEELKRDLEGQRRAQASFAQAGQPGAKEAASRPEVTAALANAWEVLGLAARTGDDCQLASGPAQLMQRLSAGVRSSGVVTVVDRKGRIKPPVDRDHVQHLCAAIDVSARAHPSSPAPSPVPTITQMLQAETEPTRMALVNVMEYFQDPVASRALAQRALFDLSPSVRTVAISRLAQRPRGQYRALLLEGFRHPWAPAARHAAEALIALKDRNAIPALQDLLNERDPSAPTMHQGKPVVRELVRVNHLKNCQLCHASAFSGQEPVVGRVPRPDKPLPPGVLYYSFKNLSKDDILVRADITYIRQDFSVVLPVKNAAPWPEMQRFDFLVRTRPATAEELAAQKGRIARSPQREAILHALDGLK